MSLIFKETHFWRTAEELQAPTSPTTQRSYLQDYMTQFTGGAEQNSLAYSRSSIITGYCLLYYLLRRAKENQSNARTMNNLINSIVTLKIQS
jgi:hypothetical protein